MVAYYKKRDGAEAARWAHNPKVDRSKLSPAKYKYKYKYKLIN